jgi:pyruvate formate lyase activating enzyme
VHDEDGGSTFCPRCGEKVIGRDWYELTRWRLDAHGRCASCGAPVAGIFEEKAGRWGGRRLPVRLADYAA